MRYLFTLESTDEATRELRENLEAAKKGLQALIEQAKPAGERCG